ncbi:MAG: response regulator [Anaerolineales bacterium]|nr:response regulator [Anaerolineales bacterium]
MMPAYRILIVEDQSDVRHMLRSGLETLGPEFEVVDVPSGEEAFLELTRSQFDLMIADVRLAGMTGIELQAKVLTFNPDMKVILITGVIDPKCRQDVANAGADAFFYKPIEMSDLFDTVETLLELEKTKRKADREIPSPPSLSPTPELVERLASLKDELKATSAFLLHTNGEITTGVGGLPDPAIQSDLMPMVLELLNIETKISQTLGKDTPEDLLCISGKKYNLSLSHVDADHSLLIVTNIGSGSEYIGSLGFSVHCAAHDLSDLLAHAAPTPSHEITEDDVDSTITETDDDPLTPLPDIEDIFKAENMENLNSDDFDSFWDSDLEDDVSGPHFSSSTAISYNEAQKLGITPDKDTL